MQIGLEAKNGRKITQRVNKVRYVHHATRGQTTSQYVTLVLNARQDARSHGRGRVGFGVLMGAATVDTATAPSAQRVGGGGGRRLQREANRGLRFDLRQNLQAEGRDEDAGAVPGAGRG